MRRLLFLLSCLLLTVAAAKKPEPAAQKPALDVSMLKAMQWREVGPFRGGRADAVEGIAGDRSTYYFGSSGGGVWKTTDGGQSWKNVSDGFFGGSIGAVAVAPSDPSVVYAGTGEETIRGNVSSGDGLWKSVDAGKTWTKIGLEDSRHIGRIRVHPRDPNLVYVAAMGHAFGPNETRGVYRSHDGGKTWERILFVNRDAGAVDLALDPGNPRIVYASTWRFRRTPYSFESGGEGCALWKSVDGGDTWKELSRNKGMPKGTLGIIGVSVSPSNSQNVYAIVEAKDGGVYRSRDGGDTWTKVSSESDLRQRAWYYTRIYADPKDEDTAYVVNVGFHRTKDGGKSWSRIFVPHGDNHDLWLDPNDPQRMIECSDGGAQISSDGGRTWSSEENQPTAQFYRVSTDNAFPYRLLGPQQDNSSVRIRHRTLGFAIGQRDWEPSAGCESGYIIADPKDPDVVFGGCYDGAIQRFNHRTFESRDVTAWPENPMGWAAADIKHRFQWNMPMVFSPNDPTKLYAASQFLLQSTDGGASWKTISPDLTRNDKSRLGPSGGPITKDNTSVEYYCTIFAMDESPIEPGVLWVGSDDGLVHVSRDGGAHWDNVTPKGMPDWIMINQIEASPLDKGAAYVAATMYKSDDNHPYLYKTNDYGKTWTKIVDGIPADQFTRVVRSDTKRHGLLFAGTERGIYVSFDDGAQWQSLQMKLPITPVTDLRIRDNALIVATQGRAFWMLDDIEPLRQLNADVAAKNLFLFAPPPAWRIDAGSGRRPGAAAGLNPQNGVIVDYVLRDQKPGTKVSLAFLGADGKTIREYKGEVQREAAKAKEVKASDVSKPAPEEAIAERKEAIKTEGSAAEQKPGSEEEDEARAETGGRFGRQAEDKLTDVVNGHNRFAWDMRYPDAKRLDGMILWAGGTLGPRVMPGTYTVKLTVGDQSVTAPATIVKNPNSQSSEADLKSQFDFVHGTWQTLTEMHTQIERIRDVRAQLSSIKKRLGDAKESKPIVDAATELDKKMTAVEEALYQTKNKAIEDPLNFPIRLDDKLAGVGDAAADGDWPPTAQQIAVRDELMKQIDEQLAKLKTVWDTDLPAFNKLAASVPAVKVKEEK
jgi:photosystem II stability/assembly factor-like uncharacterized protein